MKDSRRWILAAALVAAVGTAAAVVHGQSRSRARDDRASMVHVITGRGSHIGVTVRDVGKEDATKASLPDLAGVVVEEVTDDSPASTAGLQKGDIIVEFDGERVRSTRQFARLVQETPAGRQVQAAVVRDGTRVTLSIEPEQGRGLRYFDNWDWDGLGSFYARPAPPPPPPDPPRPPDPPDPPDPQVFHFAPRLERFFSSATRLGIVVDPLSPQLAEYFGTKEGVLVTTVPTDSAAAQAGLKAGDVITSVNGEAVDSPLDVRRRVQRLDEGDEFTLEIVRDKKPMTLKGTVEKAHARTIL